MVLQLLDLLILQLQLMGEVCQLLTLGLFEFLELGLDELHLVSVAFLVLSDLLLKLFDG